MTCVVKAEDLTKTYGKKTVVDHLSFDIEPGRIVGLLGYNGAGKTTTLHSLAGLTSYDGDLRVLSLEPKKDRHRLMKDVCFVSDIAVLPPWMKVRQLNTLLDGIHPNFSRSRMDEIMALTKIDPAKRIRKLSKGEVAQLHLAAALSMNAKVMILDEPTLGLDHKFKKAFFKILVEDYFDSERTIIISTHQIEEIENLVTHVMIMDQGRMLLDISVDELTEEYCSLEVTADNLEEAKKLEPFHEEEALGRTKLFYHHVPQAKLSSLGNVGRVSLSTLFEATVEGGSK